MNERPKLSITRLMYDKGIDPLTDFIHEERRFPVLVVPSQIESRTNSGISIRAEAEAFAGLHDADGVLSGLTIPAAPHTLSSVRKEDLSARIESTIGRKPEIPVLSEDVAAHLLVWMWGEQGTRVDALALSLLPDTERQRYIDAIEHETERGVKLLSELLQLPPSEASKSLRLYGLWGHGTMDERKQTGLVRGAQSQEDFHINIAHLSSLETATLAESKEVTLSELMKQIGAWDTVVFELFDQKIQNRMLKIVQARLPGKVVGVTTEQVHGSNSDGSAVRYHEGFRLKFLDGVTFSESMQVLLDIVQEGEVLYSGLRDRYDAYQKNNANPIAVASIRDEMLEFVTARGFDGKIGQKMVDLTLNVKPTYIQVCSYTDALMKEGKSEHDASLKHLQQTKKRYEKLHERLNQPNGREKFSQVLLNHYGFTQLEADIFTRKIEDHVRPVKEAGKIEFTMPVHMSGSYLFRDYDIKPDGTIGVNELTVATRIGSTKGMIEDLVGVVIRRETAE